MQVKMMSGSFRVAALWLLAVVVVVSAVTLIVEGGRPAVAAGDCQYQQYAPYGGSNCRPAKTSLDVDAVPTIASKGDTLQAVATIAGGNAPTGQVVFGLYAPSDPTCSARPAHKEFVDVVDGVARTSTGFVVPVKNRIGTWNWSARYTGDAGNKSAKSLCGDAPVVVSKSGGEATDQRLT